MDTRTILTQLQAERDRLDEAITALRQLGGTTTNLSTHRTTRTHQASTNTTGKVKSIRRGMSPAARRKLSLSMKRRWATGQMRGRAA